VVEDKLDGLALQLQQMKSSLDKISVLESSIESLQRSVAATSPIDGKGIYR
jgi:hypothetical protein